MRFSYAVALGLLLAPFAFSQTSDSSRSAVSPTVKAAPPAPQVQTPAAQAQQPPSYANYSIMLVNPAPGGGAVILMHNPKNELELVEVGKIQAALSAGYVAVRSAELAELIASFKEEIARLSAENVRLQGQQAKQVSGPAPVLPSPAEQQAQLRAQIAAEKEARRQQMIQSWLMLQNINRPQTQNLNVTVSDCTRFPALCAGK
jgi:hypothetical protein